MKMKDHTDPLSAYHSKAASFGKVVRSMAETKRINHEWIEQLKFCKWMNYQYPNILYRSDIQSSGKLPKSMQGIKLIIDPFKSWPDIHIYARRGIYAGLHIELKRNDSGVFLMDGSLSKSKHVQEQNERHKQLREIGYMVEFCEGFENAKQLTIKYLNS